MNTTETAVTGSIEKPYWDPIVFKTLYKKSGTGTLQEWDISVRWEAEPSSGQYYPTIVTEFGQIDGKKQTAKEYIKEGKSLGKKNATTSAEQAHREAASKWELQKKKKGYVDTVEAAQAGEVDASVAGGIFPMLAQKFEKQAEKVKYPAYVQPKFDGHRCIAIVKNGECTLWSRTRKPINSVPHINRAVERLTGGADAILDGELYNHEYHDQFEKITKLLRPNKPVEGHEKVKYYIYDMPSAEFEYADRWRTLNKVFAIHGSIESFEDTLINVETYEVASESEVPLAFDRFFGQKYEGAMLRTADNVYDGHPTRRSKGLLKLKKFDDAEFEIVDVTQGIGKMAGKAIFICRAGNGNTFDAVMNCSLPQLQEYWENRQALIGMQVTVQFQGFTMAKCVPRFPRALRLREDV